MQQAQRQASRTMSRAQDEAQRLGGEAKQQGYDEGFQLGQTEGREAGYSAAHDEAMESFQKEHSDVVQAMQEAVAAIDALKEDLVIAARRDVLELALLIARKLTFAIGEVHCESACENLDRALRLVGSKTDLVIHANPQDIAAMETFAESTLGRLDAANTVTIAADDEMAPGGCRVLTERTSIDAALETQVDEIVSLILGGHRDHD